MVENIKKFLVDLWNRNKEKLLESLKTAVRYVFFTWVSTVVSDLLSQPNLTPVMLLALSAVDKWVHETWVENNKQGLRGLFPL